MFHPRKTTVHTGTVGPLFWKLHHGDNMDLLRSMPDNCVDAVVTDPPYLISFMNRKWDASGDEAAFHAGWTRECLRVLKPGGHLVSFAATRTYHHLACAVEDAGFEIRDMLSWMYGQGMPKSLDVGKAIDKQAGVERPVLGTAADFARDGANRRTDGSHTVPHAHQGGHHYADRWSAPVTGPGSEESACWDGWGTALKPACEPAVLARKPISEGTIAANVLRWGTGGLNIGGCRVGWGTEQPTQEEWNRMGARGAAGSKSGHIHQNSQSQKDAYSAGLIKVPPGRWPANIMHDGSDEVLEHFPDAQGQLSGLTGQEPSARAGGPRQHCYNNMPADRRVSTPRVEANKSAARFFYCAKATKTDRAGSKHPTVKPIALMRWLVRLLTPRGGCVLDPFGGSGTTGAAAIEEGCSVIMAERENQDVLDIVARMNAIGAA